MQGPIAQALALTLVGNAALVGRDVSGFWPNASVFRFSKRCEFLVPDARAPDGHRLVAADPMAWCAGLRGRCRGLRLHTAPRARKPGQMSGIEDRMLVGFVGGGPRWLIEAVGEESAEIWEGFDRVLDRHDPERRIWAHAYIKQGETTPQSLSDADIAAASQRLAVAYRDAEALAAVIAPVWTEIFAMARNALYEPETPVDDIATFAALDAPQRRLLAVVTHGWVFGGMGSWNDVAPGKAEQPRYNDVSEALYRALIDAITALANSTFASTSSV